jgi:hypothetical protein
VRTETTHERGEIGRNWRWSMEIALGFSLVMAFGVLAALCQYVQRLPVAPACPCCSAVTRMTHSGPDPLRFVPHLVATSHGECTRCGWSGRMRWKWATRTARRSLD